MRLEPRDDEPGLWINPEWREGQCGTFVVIIGVSAYPHLADGTAPATQTYGLGQLKVSALTAYEVFRWLAERYRVDDCPLAKCWLLLSPIDEERSTAPGIAEHLTMPTLENCRQVIRYWRKAMRQLPLAAAQASRAIFFFSGHGLEIHQERQILLPCDYLKPPEGSWNDAISTENLKNGLGSVAVPHQFLFLDACRNDHHELRRKNVIGAEILSEDEAGLANAWRVAPLLYATASGQQAFQQPAAEKGISLFGRALLDGLAGTPDIELVERDGMCSVNLYPLQGYLKRRVVKLLAEAGAQVIQPVKLSGIVDNEVITYLDRAAIPIPAPTPVPLPGSEVPSIAPEAVPTRFSGGDLIVEVPAASPQAARVEQALDAVFGVVRPVPAAIGRGRLWAKDFDLGHELFGSEVVTAMLADRTQLFALGARQWLAPDDLLLREVERDEATRNFRIEIEVGVGDAVGHWLQIVDQGTAYGCVLPGDRHVSPRYLIEFDMSSTNGGPRALTRVEAYLAPDNPGPLGAAAQLWQRYRTSHVGEAVEAFEQSSVETMLHHVDLLDAGEHDLHDLEEIVRGKLESPLAAAVAAVILLRANRLDLLHTWVRNLANWFEDRPDGPVLWAEQVLRQITEEGPGAAVPEAVTYVVKLLGRGLPHTAEALGYAARLVDVLHRRGEYVPQVQREPLDRLRARVGAALVHFRPGGLFASYSGFAPPAPPTDLIGPFTLP